MLPSRSVECPYCGEPIDVVIDASAGAQRYVEDCSVCCRPIELELVVDPSGGIDVSCRTDDEA